MKSKERIAQLEKEIAAIKKIITQSSLTLIDESNPNVKVTLSVADGEFLTDRVTTTTSVLIENITNQKIY